MIAASTNQDKAVVNEQSHEISNNLEQYFASFRKNTVGIDTTIQTPYGEQPLIYADWTASGRLYLPIEQRLVNDFGPLLGNTHTETNATGTTMTLAYHQAQQIIKKHVNANPQQDALLMCGSGMTGALNKLIRILGFKVHENHRTNILKNISETDRPVIFVSIMEHHSNEISWRESIAEVVYIPFDENLCPDLVAFDKLLEQYSHRKIKIAAVSACSNVTGVTSNYHAIAALMHRNGGYCFADFAASAPYVSINMHPEDPDERLDAIYFSPHKFLGGPATPGVLIFNKCLYKNAIPDEPGGGTVKWVNRWGEQSYWDRFTTYGIEAREDGGTPAFLQTIKAALAMQLKEQMGVENMMARELEMRQVVFDRLKKVDGIKLLKEDVEDRLCIFSFYLTEYPLDYNLMVKLLNDRFGIQVRGGCACAGPYGHCLLGIDEEISRNISSEIERGDSSAKPGWVRMSVHPIMSDADVNYVLMGIGEVMKNLATWRRDYVRIPHSNEWRYRHYNESSRQHAKVKSMFNL